MPVRLFEVIFLTRTDATTNTKVSESTCFNVSQHTPFFCDLPDRWILDSHLLKIHTCPLAGRPSRVSLTMRANIDRGPQGLAPYCPRRLLYVFRRGLRQGHLGRLRYSRRGNRRCRSSAQMHFRNASKVFCPKAKLYALDRSLTRVETSAESIAADVFTNGPLSIAGSA